MHSPWPSLALRLDRPTWPTDDLDRRCHFGWKNMGGFYHHCTYTCTHVKCWYDTNNYYILYLSISREYIYIHIQYVCVWLFNSFPCLYIWGVGPVGSNPECGLSKVLTKSVCFYGLMISQGFLFVFLRLCSIVSYTSTKYYKVFNSIPLQRQFFRVPKANGVPSSFVGSHFYSLPDTICLMHRQLSGQALARRTRISNGGNGGCSAASLRLSAGKPMGPSLLLIKTLALTMKHGFCFTGMSWPQHVLMFHVSN